MWEFHLGITSPFRTSKIIVLALALCYFFFLEDVSHKVKYVSEASYTCYLHFFFHISQPGRKNAT